MDFHFGVVVLGFVVGWFTPAVLDWLLKEGR